MSCTESLAVLQWPKTNCFVALLVHDFVKRKSHGCLGMTFCCMLGYKIMIFFADKVTFCEKLKVKGYTEALSQLWQVVPGMMTQV
jgi:hypothetical protein